MTVAWIAVVAFAAAVLQSLTGFGFALIVMPLVTLVIDLKTAAPLIALAGLTAYTVNLIRFRRAVDIGEVARLGVASALGVAVGIWALVRVDELAINRAIGMILVAYAAYALLRPVAGRRLAMAAPCRLSPWWAYPAGFLAGCLGGAYNTPGPPVIVYGSLRQWPKDEYRAILQTLFFINGILIVGSHLLVGHIIPRVWTLYAWTAPALLLGLWTGARLDRRVDQERFRILVTAMILVLGASLLLGLGRR
ncbi:MAG: sulfite exporter TauE/SafE family protein [Anaerolineae bacterium]|nr:sulfite exporter TauE/SafE family protein [Anaerolineae bacterium]